MPQKAPKYNPLIMQLAANMMGQGARTRPGFGVRGGVASGLTAAGNSILGAMMMKKQGKAQSAEQRSLMEAMGFTFDEEGNMISPGEGAIPGVMPKPGPEGIGGAPMGGNAGSRMAASMSGIPPEFMNMKPPGQQIDPQMKEFMGKLFPEYAQMEQSFSDTAGAPTGGSTVAKKWDGLLEPGNLDLTNRPSVKNPAGGRSSVYSMSINMDGKEYLIPRVSEDGRLLSEKEAVETFTQTGNHLGVFDSAKNATKYATALSRQQAAMERGKPAVAPETKAVQKTLADHMPKEIRGLVAAMMASGDPNMKQAGLATAMGYMPQKLELKDRFVVAGGNIFDRATQTFRQPRQRGIEAVSVASGGMTMIHNYETGMDMMLTNPKPVPAKLVEVADVAKTREMGVPVSRWAWSWEDPRTRERHIEPTNHISNVKAIAGIEQPYSKPAMGVIEKKIIGARANLALFDEIDRLFEDDKFQTVGGEIEGWFYNQLGRFGVDLTEDQAKYLGDFSQFKAAAYEGINLYIKEITGAQMSEAEAKRLRKAMPDPEKDNADQFRAKLKRVKNAAKAAIETYDAMRYGEKKLPPEQAQAMASKASGKYLDEHPVEEFESNKSVVTSPQEYRLGNTVFVEDKDGNLVPKG